MNSTFSTPARKTGSPDWGELHRRIQAARMTAERGWAPAPEEKRRILKERARALARERTAAGTGGAQLEVLDFLLAGERYGVETCFIREACPLREFTPLPGAPAFVLGIVNVRGQILSVLDLKKFFDLPEKGLTDLNKVIILRSERMEFGILADVILGVRAIAATDLQPVLPTLTGIRQEFLKGISRERSVILDGAKLLTDESLVVRQEVQP